MKCWRIDISRKLTSYLHGELKEKTTERIEVHLTNCDWCRNRLEQLQQTEKTLQHIPVVSAPETSWNRIEPAINRGARSPQSNQHPVLRMIAGTAGAFIAAVFVFFLWNAQEFRSHFNPRDYHQIPISQIPQTEEPHVATVGYVSEVTMDEDDGDLTFKLVDDLHRPTHFVICEIIPPIKMNTPPVGSRIRVYGVTRYDSKADHQWFEVHPVLNIEPVQ